MSPKYALNFTDLLTLSPLLLLVKPIMAKLNCFSFVRRIDKSVSIYFRKAAIKA